MLCVACQSEETANEGGEEVQEDITLLWASHNTGSHEQDKEAIEERFPHITIEFYSANTDRESLQEMLSAQIHPDIISTYNAYRVPFFMEAQLAYDMDELVGKHQFD